MKRFDLYGWRSMPLAAAADLIARAVGVEFELHDSGYHGGDYYRSKCFGSEEILVQDNFEDEEGYLAEPNFPEHHTLVYINGASEKVARVLADVEDLEPLRSELI
ncbi:MAG: hypothetical protein ABR608_06925 [Pseudonocardiaceae bacterium]|nr:hypothetical protein [Actinomycetota bacterium]